MCKRGAPRWDSEVRVWGSWGGVENSQDGWEKKGVVDGLQTVMVHSRGSRRLVRCNEITLLVEAFIYNWALQPEMEFPHTSTNNLMNVRYVGIYWAVLHHQWNRLHGPFNPFHPCHYLLFWEFFQLVIDSSQLGLCGSQMVDFLNQSRQTRCSILEDRAQEMVWSTAFREFTRLCEREHVCTDRLILLWVLPSPVQVLSVELSEVIKEGASLSQVPQSQLQLSLLPLQQQRLPLCSEQSHQQQSSTKPCLSLGVEPEPDRGRFEIKRTLIPDLSVYILCLSLNKHQIIKS